MTTCPAQSGPIWKLDGETCGCVLDEGHENAPIDETVNGICARDHQCDCGSWWIDADRADRPQDKP